MEAFLASALLVAVAEIGDKTQLLSFVLAARLRKPWAIIAGILVATAANHALAGSVGVWLANLISAHWLPWIVGSVFVVFGLWTLKPDTLDDDEAPAAMHPAGAFMTTLIAFFMAEMGDKTQLATVALAARFDALGWVVLGTTIGMMLVNGPSVYMGERMTRLVPLKAAARLVGSGDLTGLLTGLFFVAPLGLVLLTLTAFAGDGSTGFGNLWACLVLLIAAGAVMLEGQIRGEVSLTHLGIGLLAAGSAAAVGVADLLHLDPI